MGIDIKYKSKKNIPEIYNFKRIDRCTAEGDVDYSMPVLIFPQMENECPGINHFFSTRIGGVSSGDQASLNFSYKMDSDEKCVLENFERAAAFFGCRASDIVGTDQTHTATVRVVDKKDAGHGVTIPKSFFDVDGLVTNDPDVILFVTCADCVPILFADPINKVVAAVHSGWRGTCAGIAVNALNIMTQQFGCDAKNIHVAIGPSICKDCYEVSDDLYQAFSVSPAYSEISLQDIFEKKPIDGIKGEKLQNESCGDSKDGFHDNSCGVNRVKYQLDLWRANELILLNAGVDPHNIEVTDACTFCNSDILFSHRASKGKRGGMGAFIKIEK